MPIIEINEALTRELEGGGDLGTPFEEGGFVADVADQPIGHSVRELFRALDRPMPEGIALYKRFDTWIVPHRVSIIRRRGFAEPTSVGIEIQYENENRTCSIVSLIPSFQFAEHGKISAKVQGEVSATGDASIGMDINLIPQLSIGGLKLGVAVEGGIGVYFQCTVVTPVVAATGIGSSRCEWRFDKQAEPLFGRDIETWAIVALPKKQKEVRYKMRFYLITRTAFFPTRRQSEWIDVTCQLAH